MDWLRLPTMGTAVNKKIEAVRALHVPSDPSYTSMDCEGCEPGSYAESGIGWPCATARIVYSSAEITAVTARWEADRAKWKTDHPLTAEQKLQWDRTMSIWGPLLKAQMEVPPFLAKLTAASPDGSTVTFQVVNQIEPS